MAQTQVLQTTTTTKKSTGTPFVWSSAVTGKKKTLVEMADLAAQQYANIMRAQPITQSSTQPSAAPSATLYKNTTEQKAVAPATEVAYRQLYEGEDLRQYQADRDEKLLLSQQNGNWLNCINTGITRQIPLKVNAHALKFAQDMLSNVGAQVISTKTLGEFQTAFYDLYYKRVKMYYVEMNCGTSIDGYAEFKWWLDFILQRHQTIKTEITDPKEYYLRLQEWVKWNKARYDDVVKDCYLAPRDVRPPWYYPFWVFAQNTTWENIVAALDATNGAFPKPLLEVHLTAPMLPLLPPMSLLDHRSKSFGVVTRPSPYLKSAAERYTNLTAAITWHVELPYVGVYFREKAPCKAKQKRLDEEKDEEYLIF